MYSVIMPYWQRQKALYKTLDAYWDLYGHVDGFEVIVVDDGNKAPPEIPDYIDLVRVIPLPKKDHAMNPCVPFNRGAEEARNDILVLTNPEVVPEPGVLEALKLALGKTTYVAAACVDEGGAVFCHSAQDDRAHSRMGRAPVPHGAGLHFLAMLNKTLFEHIGGFDEAYREGAGFEDNDFLWKLHYAGAQFKIVDDPQVVHYSTGTKSDWRGKHSVNRKLFYSKWNGLI